jgi:serine/threonine-protein phosphatase 2B regulatory subunit
VATAVSARQQRVDKWQGIRCCVQCLHLASLCQSELPACAWHDAVCRLRCFSFGVFALLVCCVVLHDVLVDGVDGRCAVSEVELKRLFKRFKKLDTDKSGMHAKPPPTARQPCLCPDWLALIAASHGSSFTLASLAFCVSGSLSASEFMAIPELEHNPMVKRVVATFDSDKSGEVDFREFITSLSVFTVPSAKEEKFKFTFKVYDEDNDGYISNADLFHVLKAMVGSNLNDVQLQQLVDRTILKGDKDKDGKLSYAEYLEMVKNTEIEDKLRIEF